MPIYEYQCQACGERHDALQKFSEGALRKCPACGKLKLKKLVSAAAFHLKGSGWYVTDFRDSGKAKPKGDGEGGEAKASSKEDGTSSKEETKSDSKSADKKADSKAETKADSKAETKKKDGGKTGSSASA